MADELLTKRRIAKTTVAQRIEADLRQRVESAYWHPEQALPSRRELASEYGVDLKTVQKAVSGLLVDGTLRADGVRGTFVGPNGIQPPRPAAKPTRSEPRVASIGVILQSAMEGDRLRLPPCFASIERAVSARGAICRTIDLEHPAYSGMTFEDAVAALQGHEVEGIISLVDRSPRAMEHMLTYTEKEKVPTVHAGGVMSRTHRLSVYFSAVDVGFQAASHLFRKGCRDIIVFSGFQAEWVSQRVRGAFEAARALGSSADAVHIAIGEQEIYPALERPDVQRMQTEAAYEVARQRLQNGLPADGVISVNDHNAYGFIKAASEAGYTAGVDYAILGCDDDPGSVMLGLTTMRPPNDEIGREAVDVLFRAIESPGKAMRICLPSELVPRSSTMSYVPPAQLDRDA